MIFDSTKLRVTRVLEEFCPLNYVWNIEVDDVIASDDVRVNITNEISPSSQHSTLILEAEDFATNDWRTLLQGENIAHKNVTFSLHLHNVGNLDDRIS